MFIDLFKILFCTCSLTIGWQVAIQPEMILEKVGQWANRMADRWKVFELLTCPWCGSTLFSIPAFALCFLSGFVESDYNLFFLWPVVLGASSFIDGMSWTLYQLMASKIKESKEEDGESTINS